MKKIFGIFWIITVILGILPAALSVKAQADTGAAWYDPATEGVVSGYLCIDADAGRITGLTPGVSLAQLNTRSMPGDLVASADTIATGTTLTSTAAGQTLTAVVTGDINGDGNVTITDLLMVKSYILGGKLDDLAAVAGDVNYDNEVTISDFLGIKSCLLEKSKITPQTTNSAEPLIILDLKETQTWGVAAESYCDDGSGIITISADGTITAGRREGTGFVYGLDTEGNVIARAAVTVLKGGLTVKLDNATYAPAPGKSLRATATLNHPVSAKLHWETDDPTVCSVTKSGKLTGHTPGSTTLRVTLPNGHFAEAPIRVIPPITSMDFETHLHKLKPGTTRQLPLVVAPADSGEAFIWTSSNPSIATVSDRGVVTAIKKGTVTITAKGKYTGQVAKCSVKVCNVIQIAMTFDDGPSAYTPRLLDWLKENEVKVSFFLVGNRIPSYKNTVKRMASEGHEIGYHSYAHKFQPGLSTEQIISDYNKSNKTLNSLTGQGFTLWRTPGGNYNDRVLNAIKLPHIMWTLDTRDWKSLNTQAVYKAIINQADDGEIILLHDLYKSSVNGAIKAMTEMLAGDYEFLTVTELLSRNGTPPAPSKTYRRAP